MKNLYAKNAKLLFSSIFLLSIFNSLQAQIGGNQIYKNKNSYETPSIFPEISNYAATDSTLVINAKVLLNQTADQYKITLGTNEEAAASKKSIENINNRINSFIKRISSLGIKKDDVFVDFISLTKVYDFDIEPSQKIITQKIKGFEIKKNIIITVNEYSKIEKLISEASDFEIYDIIKVDYINTNIGQIQQTLLDEAYSIIDKKREAYIKQFKREITGLPTANSNFTYLFPKSQYQDYTAFESSDFDVVRGSYNSDSYIKKLERKGKTFYYEGTGYSGFDKVIHNADPEIGIQYVMNMSVKYNLKKSQ